ncbi:DNA primase family protein [Paenibacillus sp. BIC5C1]|uniref:DNA primase family protein n=1 Tax=Paenibacillus sp. BIC5C1 TaxID=3078263 RepID=UPI0028E46B41|nr:phage/plasmid primase, P4 family [Paenibacillus sp. BIC5C1]
MSQKKNHWSLDISNTMSTVSPEYLERNETLDNDYVTVVRRESVPSDVFIQKFSDEEEFNLDNTKSLGKGQSISHLVKDNDGHVSNAEISDIPNHRLHLNRGDDVTYKVATEIVKKLIIKCSDKKIYVYNDLYGYFQEVTELQLAIHIRSNIPTDVDKKMNKNRMIEVIHRIESNPDLQIEGKEFNRYSHLINFRNGVYNLEDKIFQEHHSDYLFTTFIDGYYEERLANNYSGYANYFDEFLNECTEGNIDKQRTLQEITGYILSNYCNAKKFFILLGKAHSGKSLWLGIWRSLIGESFTTAVTLKQLGANRFMAAELFKSKLNISPEMNEEGSFKGVDVIKAVTGGDLIAAEKKGKDPFYFYSKTKIVAAGNHMPSLSKVDTTGALTDRMLFVMFNHSIPEERRDKDLLGKILEEKSYIILWALDGLKRLKQRNFIFTESSDAIDYKKQFIFESGITGFVEDCCLIDVGDREIKTHRKVLYDAYISYCKNNQSKAMSSREFFNEIVKTGVEPGKFRIDGTTPLAGFRGIMLKHS